MLYALVASALVAAVSAQGEPNPIYPDGVNSPPPNSNFPKDAFILSTVPLNAPSDTSSIYNCTGITPKITLTGSALTDSNGSTGSIVANDQFQFDGPPQAGVKVSAGWYRNKNSTLSLGTAGDSAVFYNCLSGSFSNIYRTSIGAQCVPVFLALQLCTADTSCGANYTTIKKDGTPQFQIPKVNTDDSLLAPTSYFDASSCTPGATTSAASSSSATSTVSSISSAATTLTTSAAVAPTTVPTTSTPMMVPTQIQPMMTAAAAPAPAPVSGSNATVASATPSTSAPVAFKSGNAAPVVIAGGKVGAVLAVVAGAFALA